MANSNKTSVVTLVVVAILLVLGLGGGAFYWGYTLMDDPAEYSLIDTRDVKYIGKYTISSTALVGSTVVITDNYLLVFKQFDDYGNSTVIEIDVSKDSYDSTESILEPLRMQFFQNDEGKLKIGWGNSLKTVQDYDSSTAANGYNLEEAVFEDELYSPELH